MEKLFENTTTYTKDVYSEFVKFHNEKYNLRYHLYTLFVLSLIVFCMVSQFLYGNITIGILFIFVMVIFLMWRVFHPILFTKKEASSNKVKNQLKNTYSFYNGYMKISNATRKFKI